MVVADLELRKAQAVADEIRAIGKQANAQELNVADGTSATHCVEMTVKRYRRLTILVNNAGIFQSRLSLELTGQALNVDCGFRTN